MSTSRNQSPPVPVKHPAAPQWGHGLLVKEADDKRFYEFEDGQSHIIGRAFWDRLVEVPMSAEDLESLELKLSSRRARSTSPSKAAKKRLAKPPTTTFAAQLAWFSGEFVGGFAGAEWLMRERGVADKKAAAFKAYAIAVAQKELAKSELEPLLAAEDFGGIVARVQNVLRAAGNLLHPLGDLLPFNAMSNARHPAFAKAVVDLLHGKGDFAPRFDAFAAVLAQDKLDTWPLVSVLPALFSPGTYVFVKPTVFETQAAIMSFALDYQRRPSAAGYARMCDMARELGKQLGAGGSSPVDLVDVFGFIARANAKPKAPKAKAAKSKAGAPN